MPRALRGSRGRRFRPVQGGVWVEYQPEQNVEGDADGEESDRHQDDQQAAFQQLIHCGFLSSGNRAAASPGRCTPGRSAGTGGGSWAYLDGCGGGLGARGQPQTACGACRPVTSKRASSGRSVASPAICHDPDTRRNLRAAHTPSIGPGASTSAARSAGPGRASPCIATCGVWCTTRPR